MSQIHDVSQKHYAMISRLVVRACRQLNLRYMPTLKSELFEVSPNWTIRLPENAVRPIKVGYIRSGKMALFNIGSDIHDSQISGCSCESDSSSCEAHTFYGCCTGAVTYGTLCMTGHPLYVGDVSWDPDNHVLMFPSQPSGSVLVQYEVVDDDKAVHIPITLLEAVIQRVLMWFHQQNRPQVSAYHHQQFRIELNEAKKLMEVGTYDDLVSALRGSYSPKQYRSIKHQSPEYISEQTLIVDVGNEQGIPGPYPDDSTALLAGVQPGHQYFVSADNEWGLPYGTVKVVGT